MPFQPPRLGDAPPQPIPGGPSVPNNPLPPPSGIPGAHGQGQTSQDPMAQLIFALLQDPQMAQQIQMILEQMVNGGQGAPGGPAGASPLPPPPGGVPGGPPGGPGGAGPFTKALLGQRG